MKKMIKAVLITAVVGFVGFNNIVSANVDNLPFYDSAEFTPHWIQPDSKQLVGFHHIPEFSFTNQDGKTITDAALENKIYVANFFFSTCPGICPKMRSQLANVQAKYKDDEQVYIVSHSIRPSIDTPEVLQQYADANGVISGKWHLLTGDQQEIYTLAKQAYFASEDLGGEQFMNDFLHTENLLLIDHNGRIRGVYNGLNTASVNHLIEDIDILKRETQSVAVTAK